MSLTQQHHIEQTSTFGSPAFIYRGLYCYGGHVLHIGTRRQKEIMTLERLTYKVNLIKLLLKTTTKTIHDI